MSLKPYQQSLELGIKNKMTYAELSLHKKRVIAAYFSEAENRMWAKFAEEKWSADEAKNDVRAKEIVIEISREINTEWNTHRDSVPDSWLPHNGFIQLASVTFDFPIKLVPIMR